VTNGYPGRQPGGQNAPWNVEYNAFGFYVQGGVSTLGYAIGTAQYRNTQGHVKSGTTASVLRTTLDSGQGQSGSPIYYFYDNSFTYSGQGHWIIGLLTRLNDNSVFGGGRWTGGPTVGQFRQFADSLMNP